MSSIFSKWSVVVTSSSFFLSFFLSMQESWSCIHMHLWTPPLTSSSTFFTEIRNEKMNVESHQLFYLRHNSGVCWTNLVFFSWKKKEQQNNKRRYQFLFFSSIMEFSCVSHRSLLRLPLGSLFSIIRCILPCLQHPAELPRCLRKEYLSSVSGSNKKTGICPKLTWRWRWRPVGWAL